LLYMQFNFNFFSQLDSVSSTNVIETDVDPNQFISKQHAERNKISQQNKRKEKKLPWSTVVKLGSFSIESEFQSNFLKYINLKFHRHSYPIINCLYENDVFFFTQDNQTYSISVQKRRVENLIFTSLASLQTIITLDQLPDNFDPIVCQAASIIGEFYEKTYGVLFNAAHMELEKALYKFEYPPLIQTGLCKVMTNSVAITREHYNDMSLTDSVSGAPDMADVTFRTSRCNIKLDFEGSRETHYVKLEKKEHTLKFPAVLFLINKNKVDIKSVMTIYLGGKQDVTKVSTIEISEPTTEHTQYTSEISSGQEPDTSSDDEGMESSDEDDDYFNEY
jgi:hypothetical protein